MLRYEIIKPRDAVVQAVTLRAGARSLDATFTCGEVRLLRSKAFKGSFFTPVISTVYALLIFPNSCAPGGGRAAASCASPSTSSDIPVGTAAVTMEAQSCIGHFLSQLEHINFCIADAAACSFSGCAIVVLACPTMQEVLSVLEACAEVAVQGEDVRTSCMYVKGFACADGAATEVDAQTLLSHYYIPTCPMCSDRLECSVSGNGSQMPLCTCPRGGSAIQCACFLCSSCHVCRRFAESLEHTQQQQQQQQHPSAAVVKCEACSKAGDPWICLVCGYVGCSRYQAMHAKEHCVAHQHFFSMNLLTQQIWDYDGDCFVHRVVVLVDSNTGSSTRVQFPGRDEPMLDETVAGDGATLAGTLATSDAPEAWKAEKKSISAKYDKKLTSSHAQYAMVIKSELDAKRALYESQLAHEAGSTSASTSTSSISSDEDDAGQGNDTTRTGDRRVAVDDGCMDIVSAFEPLESVMSDLGAKRRKTTALLYAVRNLEHELDTRGEETARLEKELEGCKRALRAVIQLNVAADLRLSSSIRELKETLHDIALNAETQRRLTAQLGEQGVSRVVLVGGGGNARSRGPTGVRKRQEKPPPKDSKK
ncbi:Zn-finger in ubiquitin-hydrolases family protein [Novymonas esmeraldas]|uniref:Zn-finger in ubiquitin-hydrolases family protein n=1 Tax=Novymonas esmeraldas TaxID=1808958 RepID=A0AAW0EQ88_9TRYP